MVETVLSRRSVVHTARAAGGDEIDAVWLQGDAFWWPSVHDDEGAGWGVGGVVVDRGWEGLEYSKCVAVTAQHSTYSTANTD